MAGYWLSSKFSQKASFFIEKIKGCDSSFFLPQYERIQWLSSEQIQNFQWNCLSALLKYAYNNIPYYREIFQSNNLHPEDVHSLDDFLNVPIIERHNIQTNFEKLFSSRMNKSHLRLGYTGGSTGEPLKFYIDKKSISRKNASTMRLRKWWDISIGDRVAMIWGASYSFDRSLRGRIKAKTKKITNFLKNIEVISAYNISEASLERYYHKLVEFKPKCIYAYASSIYFFAKFINEKGMDAKALCVQLIIVTSEPLYSNQRCLIENTFGCRVVNEYGCSEVGIIAFECPAGGFHLVEDDLYVEIINGQNHAKPGEIGNVVITTLHNFDTPFIRYKIGDMAVLTEDRCKCGRGFSLLNSVQGRSHDQIINSQGEIIHGEFFSHIFDHLNHVRRFKVIQKARDQIELHIEKDLKFEKNVEQFVRNEIKKYFSSETNVQFIYCNEIPVEKSGKFRWVVSELNPD